MQWDSLNAYIDFRYLWHRVIHHIEYGKWPILMVWYGLSDTFTKTWSGGLSCRFVASCLPAIVAIAVDDSKSFSFPGCSLIRIVSSITHITHSGSLMHGFNHDKSVLCVFSTCLDFSFGGFCEEIVRVSIINAQKPSTVAKNCITVVSFTLADLLGNQ